MTLKAKISGSLFLPILLGQLFDASLFPHTHFFHGRFIAPVEEGNDAGQPEPCHAQELFFTLMSATVVAAALFSAVVAEEYRRTETLIDRFRPFLRYSESRRIALRGPPIQADIII